MDIVFNNADEIKRKIIGEENINEDNTKVFDFLLWCCNGRIHNYLFGETYDTKDKTQGGKNAFEMSA